MLNTIYGPNTFQHILDRTIYRILTRLQRQTFVPHILKGNHLPAYFLLREFFSQDMTILRMKRTVHTSIDTIIGEIQRRKHHNSVSIKILFDLFRQRIDLLIDLLILTRQKHRSFPMIQSLSFLCFLQYLLHQFAVVFIFICICQRIHDLLMTDKFFCFSCLCTIHLLSSLFLRVISPVCHHFIAPHLLRFLPPFPVCHHTANIFFCFLWEKDLASPH